MGEVGSLYIRRDIPLFESGAPIEDKEIKVPTPSVVMMRREAKCFVRLGDIAADLMDFQKGEYGISDPSQAGRSELGHIYVTAASTAVQGDVAELAFVRGIYAAIIGDKFSGDVSELEGTPAILFQAELQEPLGFGATRKIADRLPATGFDTIFAQVSEGDRSVGVELEAFDSSGTSLGTATDTANLGAAAGAQVSNSDIASVDVTLENTATSGDLTTGQYLIVGVP